MNNFARIKKMTIEEMTEFLAEHGGGCCVHCAHFYAKTCKGTVSSGKFCKEGIKHYLGEEAV